MQKTITTFLVDGTLEGVQNIFDESGVCELFVIPRTCLSYCKEEEQLNMPALYILLGGEEEQGVAYIGETESFRLRVKDHESKKAFWDKALVFVSKNAAINKANVQYLEYLALMQAKGCSHFTLAENKQTPKCPHLAKQHKAPIDHIFEEIKFLTAFAGCPIFVQSVPMSQAIAPNVVSDVADLSNRLLVYAKTSKVDATAYFYPETKEMILLKSSVIPGETGVMAKADDRKVFLNECTSMQGESCILTCDSKVMSLATATNFCTGYSTNAWKYWKDADGKTIDELFRTMS